MPTEPHWDMTFAPGELPERVTRFPGELRNVTDARLDAERFLGDLAEVTPPATPEHWDDILLVVTELAANAIQYAPGPFELTMRRSADGVHVVMADTSTVPPAPRPFRPDGGGGGVGWHLLHALCSQISVTSNDKGKGIHVFLPW